VLYDKSTAKKSAMLHKVDRIYQVNNDEWFYLKSKLQNWLDEFDVKYYVYVDRNSRFIQLISIEREYAALFKLRFNMNEKI
jgi:hypothetical protein